MASVAPKIDVRLSVFRRLICDARNPARISKNPLAAGVCNAGSEHLADAFRAALHVSLYRLPPRQRAIVTRYDLDGRPVEELCKLMGLSRRQFFRDHRAALQRLAGLMLPALEAEPAAGLRAQAMPEVAHCEPVPLDTPARSLARGLQNAGAYAEAIGMLRRSCDAPQHDDARLDALLDIASLCVESGDISGAAAALDQARGHAASLGTQPRLAAHLELIEGHLASSHMVRQQKYERARALLETSTRNGRDAAGGALLVETLYALSLSHDHRGRWPAARQAARDAVLAAERFALSDSPLGLMVRANDAMRDARQYGNVDAALATLRSCLGRALRNGWVQVAGDVTVHFINLNLMRSQYAQALQWRRWILDVDESRLTARTRNFLAVDTAHALTMLGRPDRAQGVLRFGNDEGLAFHGAREYWRAEALQAEGDVAGAFILASRALDGAAEADCEKGRARSKRVLAKCQHALGHARSARRIMTECIELSEQFVSPYDLLLSISAAQKIDLPVGNDERELARLLRGVAGDADFAPPGNVLRS